MKNRVIFLLLVSLVVLPLYASAAARVGGWSPIDTTEPHIKEIGEFAVSEYNRQSKSGLEFVTVADGESQVVSGMNYRLTVLAMDGGAKKNYVAVVWEKPWLKSMTLTSFKPANRRFL